MTENTKIEWADHTFNPWVGCEKISPACDHCYAESWAKRTGNAGLWSGERRRTTAANWRQPLKWNAACEAAGTRARVFCASLADVFDNEAPTVWRAELFALIHTTPGLDWLLLTKRIGNARRMLEECADWHFDHGDRNVAGWLTDWYKHGIAPPNVWLGSTIANQEEADRDIPKLLSQPARVRFLSCEPMLGPINLRNLHIGFSSPLHLKWGIDGRHDHFDALHAAARARVDWVIAGCESGGNARPAHIAWVRALRDQSIAAGVPFLFKQWGEWGPAPDYTRDKVVTSLFVDGYTAYRVGKKSSGRELDGRTWDQFPEVA